MSKVNLSVWTVINPYLGHHGSQVESPATSVGKNTVIMYGHWSKIICYSHNLKKTKTNNLQQGKINGDTRDKQETNDF